METLEKLGAIAGVAGISLGVFLLIFRDVVRKTIFSNLPPAESYRLLRLIIILTWSIAVLGVLAWWFGNRPLPTLDWKASPKITNELSIGLSRDYILGLTGNPPNSLESEIGGAIFKIDRYGDNCCGELILFYQKNVLVAFSAKHFVSPDFPFRLYTYAPENFSLGKSTFKSVGDQPMTIKDDYIGGHMSICYLEMHYYGNPGNYKNFYFSTTIAMSNRTRFDPEKIKDKRNWPIEGVLVADEDLFCTSEDKIACQEEPWRIACTYFDNLFGS